MNRPNNCVSRLSCLLLFLLVLEACSVTPYKNDATVTETLQRRAETQTQGLIQVRASVPGKVESERLFGIPIYNRGIQPVWLEVTNNSNERARLVHLSLDQEYFSPFEVAYIHKKYFSKQGWQDLEQFLYKTAIPRFIQPGQTVSGFIYTHASDGTKGFNVDVFHRAQENGFEEFTFFITVPGFTPDHASVDFEELYANSVQTNLDSEGLRAAIEDSSCCTTNRAGTGKGQPVNILLVATGQELLQSFLRAGWSETTYDKDDNYLNNVNYLFDRPPDAVLRKSRGKSTSTERNEISLWMAPFQFEGTPVWIAHMKHAIGRRYQINEIFFGSAQDPDVDDGRNFLLQNLWYSQSLSAVAYLQTPHIVAMEKPNIDFNNNSYFTDGLRIVMWLSADPVALQDTKNMNWDTLQ